MSDKITEHDATQNYVAVGYIREINIFLSRNEQIEDSEISFSGNC